MDAFIIATPIGHYQITYQGDEITAITATRARPTQNLTTQAQAITQQFNAYFNDSNTKFTLKTRAGTLFQQRFRRALAAIPVGQTRTYGEVAKELNSSPRAIGQACRHNPLPIIIPCHRVVAKDDLGGYAGTSTANKKKKIWLLQHESHS